MLGVIAKRWVMYKTGKSPGKNAGGIGNFHETNAILSSIDSNINWNEHFW